MSAQPSVKNQREVLTEGLQYNINKQTGDLKVKVCARSEDRLEQLFRSRWSPECEASWKDQRVFLIAGLHYNNEKKQET